MRCGDADPYDNRSHAKWNGEVEGMWYFAKAIETINKNLCDENKRTSDNMIACVSMFANMEVRQPLFLLSELSRKLRS